MSELEPRRSVEEIEERLGRPLTDEERAALAATLHAEAERGEAQRRAAEARRRREPAGPRPGLRGVLDRLWGPVVAIGAFLVKFGGVLFKAKFLFSAFISVGWYALFWGWQLGVGFVVLIFLHELGHVAEARRQGLQVHKLQFVPLFGAYVMYERARDAVRGAQIALAGPVLGGLAALACWGIGEWTGSDFWLALAYLGFLVNALNLLPVWVLDGAAVVRASNPWILLVGTVGLAVVAYRSHNVFLVLVLAFVAVLLFQEGRRVAARGAAPDTAVDPGHANLMAVAYAVVAVLLVLGAVATHLPDPRR